MTMRRLANLLIVITYISDCFSDDLFDVDFRLTASLSSDSNHPGLYHRFAGNSRIWILFNHRINNCVRNLVSNFVRMAILTKLLTKFLTQLLMR